MVFPMIGGFESEIQIQLRCYGILYKGKPVAGLMIKTVQGLPRGVKMWQGWRCGVHTSTPWGVQPVRWEKWGKWILQPRCGRWQTGQCLQVVVRSNPLMDTIDVTLALESGPPELSRGLLLLFGEGVGSSLGRVLVD
jgi:hypothetical protein